MRAHLFYLPQWCLGGGGFNLTPAHSPPPPQEQLAQPRHNCKTFKYIPKLNPMNISSVYCKIYRQYLIDLTLHAGRATRQYSHLFCSLFMFMHTRK